MRYTTDKIIAPLSISSARKYLPDIQKSNLDAFNDIRQIAIHGETSLIGGSNEETRVFASQVKLLTSGAKTYSEIDLRSAAILHSLSGSQKTKRGKNNIGTANQILVMSAKQLNIVRNTINICEAQKINPCDVTPELITLVSSFNHIASVKGLTANETPEKLNNLERSTAGNIVQNDKAERVSDIVKASAFLSYSRVHKLYKIATCQFTKRVRYTNRSFNSDAKECVILEDISGSMTTENDKGKNSTMLGRALILDRLRAYEAGKLKRVIWLPYEVGVFANDILDTDQISVDDFKDRHCTIERDQGCCDITISVSDTIEYLTVNKIDNVKDIVLIHDGTDTVDADEVIKALKDYKLHIICVRQDHEELKIVAKKCKATYTHIPFEEL